MRLFEAIVEANHRALAGDQKAGLHVEDFADALPIIALTCIDPRLNPLMPEVLGIPEAKFIWLRNAGNIIFDSMSSMTRTLALACAVKGGKEIAIIGHTDCHGGQTSVARQYDRGSRGGPPLAFASLSLRGLPGTKPRLPHEQGLARTEKPGEMRPPALRETESPKSR